MGKKENPPSPVLHTVKSVFANLGRILLALMMVGIITGCIVASVLTVYILRYIDTDDQIDLRNIELNYTTIIYAEDTETGEPFELQRLHSQENRIWVDYEKIPKHVANAAIAIEDQRFNTHHGVDWKRTLGAFVNLFIPIYSSKQGGSTITQQLIKNITGEDAQRIERKVEEIFRALNLEKRFSKEEIMEAYLNTVHFGRNTNGIQAAANLYFDKNASELTVAEAASIVGITKAPTFYDPFINPENNQERKELILHYMHKQGLLTDKEYEDAAAQKVEFSYTEAERSDSVQDYFTDHVMDEVIDDLVVEKGYTRQKATNLVLSGGYRIFTTVDVEMQKYLEEKYKDPATFPPVKNAEYPQSAFVITDPNGKILSLVGGTGEKEYSRSFNRATQAKRHPGSAIKPIGPYANAFENDMITWSTMIEDSPMLIKDGGVDKLWPVNYYDHYKGYMTIDEAIQRSCNTVAAKITNMLTPRLIFDFLTQKLHMDSLIERVVVDGAPMTDLTLSGMALGGLTEGVTPLEMAGAYQIFANGGLFTEPYSYTKVLDSEGDVVLEKDTTPRRVISAETATIMNKLLQRVTTGVYGTGTAAKIPNMPVAGKTGTSSDDYDQWFCGVTPYYVGVVWMGYDQPKTISYQYYGPPILWKTIMGPLHENLEPIKFPESTNVVSKTYCTKSGDLALETCPTTASGWYNVSNLPGTCTLHLATVESDELPDEDFSFDFGNDEDDGGNWWDDILS